MSPQVLGRYALGFLGGSLFIGAVLLLIYRFARQEPSFALVIIGGLMAGSALAAQRHARELRRGLTSAEAWRSALTFLMATIVVAPVVAGLWWARRPTDGFFKMLAEAPAAMSALVVLAVAVVSFGFLRVFYPSIVAGQARSLDEDGA